MTPRRFVLMTALKLYDLVLAAACFAAAATASARAGVSIQAFLAMRISIRNILLLAALLVGWHVVLVAFGVYRSKRLMSVWREIAGLLRATAAGSAAIYLLALLFRIRMVGGLFLPVFFALTSTTTVLSRLVLRSALRAARRRGRNLRHVLIVGTNRRAVACARKLHSAPELGCRVVGFVDAAPWHGAADVERSGDRLLGDLRVLPELLRRGVVDEVMVFLPLKSFYEQGSLIVQQCEEQGVRVTLPSSAFDCKKARVLAEGWSDADPVVTLASGAIVGGPAVMKRMVDVAVAASLLVLLAPLLVAVAIAIKVTSPGPALFAQERVGLGKRRFRMLKFRTMVSDAEGKLAALEHLNEASGPVFKIRKDPRITPLGAVLRSTSIDELPQLLNVLRGDLSLVGPRPLPVRDYEGFNRDWHRRRFSVRPGITCLWQVGGRSNVSFDRWMELDMEYIDTWSLWLDVKILVRTIPAVLRGTGAA